MDIEFHYYITYFIALKAGFKSDDAYAVAYSSQHVDDNTEEYKISQGTADAYNNYISQTSDILKPEKKLMRIYPAFHFMPGKEEEIDTDSALRRDGKFHILNTIPDNSNARSLLKEALNAKDLYRIGIASHMYCDTFAHQNFVGYYESVNSMKGILEKVIPDIGHADAQHWPDWPGEVWEDVRLIKRNGNVAEIDNKERFLLASGRLFEEYRKYIDPACSDAKLQQDKSAMISTIDKAIGEHDKDNRESKNRTARYKSLITSADNGFKDYVEKEWFTEAVDQKWFRPFTSYNWKENYKESHWYKFQEAIKAHQKHAMSSILDSILVNLELERW